MHTPTLILWGANDQVTPLRTGKALAARLPVETHTLALDVRDREAVDRDWQLSQRMGITAVPTFVIDGQVLVGFDGIGQIRLAAPMPSWPSARFGP